MKKRLIIKIRGKGRESRGRYKVGARGRNDNGSRQGYFS